MEESLFLNSQTFQNRLTNEIWPEGRSFLGEEDISTNRGLIYGWFPILIILGVKEFIIGIWCFGISITQFKDLRE